MTEIVQNLAPKILEEIQKAKNILLHCHVKPDADSVGGALATMHALKAIGKQVTVIKGDSDLPAEFSCLPGFDKILLKNISEIDLSQFDLFIIQDSGDLNRISQTPDFTFPTNLKTITIDHHATNPNYSEINLVDATYPANCQLLHDLFTLWHVEITKEIAICLFAGIFTDTGGFKYRSVTKDTFSVAAKLVELVPNFSDVISTIENSNDPKQIEFEAIALSSIKTYFGSKIAMTGVAFSSLQEKGIPNEFTSSHNVVQRMLSVASWDVVISMTEEMVGGVKISFRSKDYDKYDVSKIAATLGGGGHRSASGLYLKMSLAEAQQKVLGAISATYPELG